MNTPLAADADLKCIATKTSPGWELTTVENSRMQARSYALLTVTNPNHRMLFHAKNLSRRVWQ